MPPATAPTVLLADDEPDVREVVRLFLEMDGFEVVGDVADGAEAIRRLVDLRPPPVPSVVVLDQRMPVMTGLKAAERILEIHPDQLVVLFSAVLDSGVERRARELGVAACVSKMDPSGLPSILRRLLAEN